ncbi:DUF885 domain-containing protein [Streptomyces sp. NPDC048172]|uniref:DUF885 domain-containing protein n=1 Tax=Streptomyces sp. NPDC048172 TaxID=3365505 RepID=UPI00371E0704
MTKHAPNDRLSWLGSEYFRHTYAEDPFAATAFGIPGHEAEVPDPSRDGDRRRLEALDGLLQKFGALDPAALDDQDRVTYTMLGRLLRGERDEMAAGFGRGAFEVGVSGSVAGVPSQVFATVPTTARLRGEADADAYLRRLRGLGGYFEALSRRYRQAAAEGRVPPAHGVRQAAEQLRAYLASDPAGDLFLRPATDDRQRERILTVVRDVVRPALARHAAALTGEILPRARSDGHVGLCHVPGGEAAYQVAAQVHTTTDLTPEEIHGIGLDHLGALRAEFAETGSRALGTSDVTAVLRRLRADPALRFEDAGQILDSATTSLRRAEAAMRDWFRDYALAPCVVEATHPAEAEGSTLAYYRPPAADGSRPGAHVVNTHEPRSRPRFEYEALAFHESLPGHHLQIALAQSRDDLPDFQRFAFLTAHGEGWGLYVERLADEMGLYTSDLDRLGMLSFDAWRACRLVVDTGMHHLGWSRTRAIEFLRANSALSESNIRNEVDRYIAWPGQALAYLIGRLRIEQLRHLAERRLGSGFSVKDFHHHVLAHGAVPLDTLDDIIRRWIERGWTERPGG